MKAITLLTFQAGRVHAPASRLRFVRSAILLSIAGVLVLFGNFTSVTETVSSVYSSRPAAARQNAIHNGQHVVNGYAGSAAEAAAAIPPAVYPTKASTAHVVAKPKKPQPKRYIVLPATASSANFCRTVFSLLINGYGPPIVINWGGRSGINHYGKIKAGYRWLHQRGGREDDVVLTVDAHDVWAQLPAKAFFKQYSEYPARPGAIIGAEKHCYPHPEDHPRCMRLPESSLPKDIYGDLTDKLNLTGKIKESVDINPDLDDPSSWVWGRYETIRPRYINSGTVIGTRKQLKALYTEGLRKMKKVVHGSLNVTKRGSDQEIFGLVNLDRIESNRPQLLTPDVQMQLFQVMAHSYKDLYPRPFREIMSDLPKAQSRILSEFASQREWAHRQMAWNRISGSLPAFVHFAGPKLALEIWWRRMWWMQETNNEEDFGTQGKASRPVEKFLHRLATHTKESKGYGIYLANGTWLDFHRLCSPFTGFILGDEDPNSDQLGE